MSISRHLILHPEEFEGFCAAKAQETIRHVAARGIERAKARDVFDGWMRRDVFEPMHRGGVPQEKLKELRRISRFVLAKELSKELPVAGPVPMPVPEAAAGTAPFNFVQKRLPTEKYVRLPASEVG